MCVSPLYMCPLLSVQYSLFIPPCALFSWLDSPSSRPTDTLDDMPFTAYTLSYSTNVVLTKCNDMRDDRDGEIDFTLVMTSFRNMRLKTIKSRSSQLPSRTVAFTKICSLFAYNLLTRGLSTGIIPPPLSVECS